MPTTPNQMRRTLQGVLALLALLVAGCSAAVNKTPPTQTETPPVKSSPQEMDNIELAGQNVTWTASGSAILSIVVPANSTALELAYWSTGRLVGGREIQATIEMDGCPPFTDLGSGGGAVAWGWCPNPPAGNHSVKWTLQAGYMQGRICVILPLSGTLSDCLYRP